MEAADTLILSMLFCARFLLMDARLMSEVNRVDHDQRTK